MAERRRFGRALSFWVGIAVSVGFSWLTLRSVDLDGFWQEIEGLNLAILSLGLLTKSLGMAAMAARTRVLFSPHEKVSFGLATRSVFLGFVGNNVLPLRLGELLRVGFLARTTKVSAEGCLALVALERVVDTFCLLVVLGICAVVASVDVSADFRLLLTGVVVAAALGGALFVARNPQLAIRIATWGASFLGPRVSRIVGVRATRFAEGLAALASSKLLSSVLALSLGSWVAGLLSVEVVLWAFGLSLPWYAPLVVLAFLAFGTMLPSSPAFVGTYHYFGAMALGVLGVGVDEATAFAVVAHFMAFVPFTVIALPFVSLDIVRIFRGREETPES